MIERDDGPEYVARHGLTSSEYQTAFDQHEGGEQAAILHRLDDSAFFVNDEFKFDSSTGICHVRGDNPVLSLHLPLAQEHANWAGGLVPQEVDRLGSQWQTYNCKVTVHERENPNPRLGTDLGSIEVIPENDGHSTAPATVSVRLDRVRLGYAPSSLSVVISKPKEGLDSSVFTSPRLQLARETLLVPVDVTYFFHDPSLDGEPPVPKATSADEGSMRLLFDGLPYLDPEGLWNNYWDGEIKTTNRTLFQPLINQEDSLGRRTPDSVFQSAGVAFRLERYFQKGVPRNRTLPRTGEFLDDKVPFRLNRNDWPTSSSGAETKALRVIIMGRLVQPQGSTDGLSLIGGNSIGISASGESLNHEIGHALGLGHHDDPHNLMYEYPSDYGLDQDQIDIIREGASRFLDHWV